MLIGVSMATVLNLRRCPTEQRGTAESSISQSKHTDRNTHKSNYYNACESSLFTHTFTIESLRCISNKIYSATKHRCGQDLDKGKGAVRIMFFDFSSAFNTIQPLRLSDKLVQMGVNVHLVSWITDYLTERP